MRTTTFRALAAAALVSLTVTACTASRDDTVAEDRVLTVVMSDDWIAAGPVVEAARRFEEDHPGVDVRLEPEVFSDIPAEVRARIGAGQDVGLAQWHAFAAGARGWAQPITEAFDARFDRDDFLPGALEDVAWDGEIYGIPLDTNALVMITNDALLRRAGVDPDAIRTWDDLVAAAEAVAARTEAVGFLASASSWTTYGFIRANGGDLTTAGEGEGTTFTLDDPRVIATFESIVGLVETGAALPPNHPNFSGDAYPVFTSGEAAMLFSGSWDLARMRNDGTDLEVSVHVMPQAEDGDGTVLGGSSLYVPAGSEQADLALAFAAYLISDDTAGDLWVEEGRVPATRSALLQGPDRFAAAGLEDEYEAQFRVVVEQLEAAYPMRLIAFPEADQTYEALLRGLLTGPSGEVARLLEEAQASLAGS